MRRVLLIALLAACGFPLSLTARPKALFYLTQDPAGVRSFLAHSRKIDILVPTWYSVDASGLVWGGPDELVMKTARDRHVPVMPIIVNPGFNQNAFHKLVNRTSAQAHLIDSLLRECKMHGYSGIQFDFENVIWTDREALTALVTYAARSLHREGLQLSIATVPNAPGYPGKRAYSHWIYENWRGAYDLKALAGQVDLVCLMTYDEHTRHTPPGPVAGYPWVLENLDYALQSVPKEKLSLGIPLYGQRWFAPDPGTDNRASQPAASVGASDVQLLLDTFHPQVQWDPVDKTSWFYFYRDQMREWVFFTDVRTFRERWNLADERGLQGFCSWVLGREDEGIWQLLPEHP